MLTTLVAALGLGLVAGLRTLLAPAALFLVRGGIAGYVLAVASLAELGIDLYPKAPSRTRPAGLAGRMVSGAVVGGVLCAFRGAPPAAGCVLGVLGALAGAFGGKALRLWAIDRIGAVPAALGEDAVAIALVTAILVAAGPR
jgi:uncharacterized membrane protein